MVVCKPILVISFSFDQDEEKFCILHWQIVVIGNLTGNVDEKSRTLFFLGTVVAPEAEGISCHKNTLEMKGRHLLFVWTKWTRGKNPWAEQKFLLQVKFLLSVLCYSCVKRSSLQTENFVKGITKHNKNCIHRKINSCHRTKIPVAIMNKLKSSKRFNEFSFFTWWLINRIWQSIYLMIQN